MAVVTRGDVNVDVNVRVPGDGPQKIDDVDKGIDKLKGKVDGLKGTAAPVNVLREGFENLSANIGFAFTTASTLIGGVIGIATAIIEMDSESARALKRWEGAQERINTTLTRSRDLIDETRMLLLGSASDEWSRNATALATELRAVNTEIELADITARAFKDDLEDLEPVLRKLADLRSRQADIEGLIAERLRMQLVNIGLLAERAANDNEKDRKDNYGYQTDPFPTEDPEWVKEMQRKRYELLAANSPDVGGGGGGRGRSAPRRDAFDQEAFNRDQQGLFDKWVRDNTVTSGWAPQNDNSQINGFAQGKGQNAALGLSEGEKAALDFASALDQVAASIGSLVGEKMPELANAMSEIRGITQQVIDGNMGLTSALVAGGVAIAANAARAIWGVREEAAIRAAYEFAMGWATLENPVVSAGHFTASVLLGAVAAGAGKGSASGGGGGSAGGSSSSSLSRALNEPLQSGNTTVVINGDYIGNGSPQETAAELHARIQRGSGSGYVPRRAA